MLISLRKKCSQRKNQKFIGQHLRDAFKHIIRSILNTNGDLFKVFKFISGAERKGYPRTQLYATPRNCGQFESFLKNLFMKEPVIQGGER